jgi:hypothetical protein
MSDPVIDGVYLDPPAPPEGYAPNSLVTVTVRYSSPDDRPATTGYIEGAVMGADGRIGKYTGDVEFPEHHAINPHDVKILSPGNIVSTNYREHGEVRATVQVQMMRGEVTAVIGNTSASKSLPVDHRPLSIATPSPWFGAWDKWPDVVAPDGIYQRETVDIDNLARHYASPTLGADAQVNAGYRDYIVVDPVLGENSKLILTMNHLAKQRGVQRALLCVWTRAGDTATRYGNTELQAIVDGVRDEAARRMIRSLPIGKNRIGTPRRQFYIAWLHEADGYAPAGTDPALYRAAIRRLIELTIFEALALGATPYELGVGGLLTEGPMYPTASDAKKAWRWFDGLPTWMIESEFVVCFWDAYFKVTGSTSTSWPSFRERVALHKREVLPSGITRFVVAETALGMDTYDNPGVEVGHLGAMVAWIKDVAATLRAGELEGVELFSKPDGPASKYGSITRPERRSALIEWAWRAREFNNTGGAA